MQSVIWLQSTRLLANISLVELEHVTPRIAWTFHLSTQELVADKWNKVLVNKRVVALEYTYASYRNDTQNCTRYMGIATLTAVVTKSSFFWDMLYGQLTLQRKESSPSQGQRKGQARDRHEVGSTQSNILQSSIIFPFRTALRVHFPSMFFLSRLHLIYYSLTTDTFFKWQHSMNLYPI